MKTICPEELCTGCLACLNSCTHNAIEITTDICGFRYPAINQDLCVDCGLCQLSCPVIHPQEKKFPQSCYAVTVNTENELATCASGGAATALSRYVLQKGGVVYGCSNVEMRHVKHIRITKEEDLPLLKGSKYVQSDIGLNYRLIKGDLRQGLNVLFVGTPCQVAGLKSYLRKDYPNLITADLVCHGVPSQQLLNDNIDRYNRRYKEVNEGSIHFREKILSKKANQTQSAKIEYGWFFGKNQPYSGKNIAVKYYKDPYMFGFIQGLFFRNNCYKCPYAYAIRVGDFTLSDFWGLGKDSSMDVGKGASAVLINTEKAKAVFEELKKNIRYEQREVQEAIMGNGQLQHPSRRHPKYELFRELYPEMGLEKSVRMCLKKDLVKIRVKSTVLKLRKVLNI